MGFKYIEIILMAVIPIGLMFIFMIYASIKSSAARKARIEKYKKYTGRADGLITDFRTEEYRRGHGDNEKVYYKCFMDYEFEANGRIYKGKGEGSGALWERKIQKICYDPDNPENNCTKYYYTMMTGSSGMLSAFLTMIIILIIVLVIFMKIKGLTAQDLLTIIGINK